MTTTRTLDDWTIILKGLRPEQAAVRILQDMIHYHGGRSYEDRDAQELGMALQAWSRLFGPTAATPSTPVVSWDCTMPGGCQCTSWGAANLCGHSCDLQPAPEDTKAYAHLPNADADAQRSARRSAAEGKS